MGWGQYLHPSGADGGRFYQLLWSLVRFQGEDWLEEKTRREQEAISAYLCTHSVLPNCRMASHGVMILPAVWLNPSVLVCDILLPPKADFDSIYVHALDLGHRSMPLPAEF